MPFFLINHIMHKSSECDIIKYVTPCLYHTLWWNGLCDIIKVRLYLQEVVLENSPSDHETWSIGCHVEIHVDFYIHLVIHILCWSLERSVKWSWCSSAFPTNESAWSEMVTCSQSRVWSGPKWDI